MNNWINIPDNIIDYIGFVYKITNLKTGQIYIGQKKYWYVHKLKPLKGKKNKRHFKRETDWKTYWSSSPKVHNDIKKLGIENFKREIIYNCKTKSELSIMETYKQITYYINEDWNKLYNEVINLRLRLPK